VGRPFLEGLVLKCSRLGSPELERELYLVRRQKAREECQAVESEMVRRGMKIPEPPAENGPEAPKKKKASKKPAG
jgi:hypothetical protein